MSANTTSSLSEISSGTTPTEIVPTTSSSTLNNSTETATNPNQNVNEENTKQPSVDHPKAKRSLRTFLRDHCKPKHKISDPKSNDNNSNRVHNEAEALSNWIAADLSFIRKASDTIKKYEVPIEEAAEQFDKLQKDGSGNRDELRELKKIVMKLKQQISSRNKDESDDVNAHRYARTNGSANFRGGNSHKLLNGMPKLYRNPTFEQSLAYKDFQVRYDDLSRALKLCLLCFSVFPENVTIKKRLMIYWWIGEGFVSEELANEFFNELTVKGFIEPVYEKRCLVADSCKMHPFVRCAIIMLAERTKFFDFDTNEGNLTEDFSRSLRACLMGKGLAHIEDLEKLHTVFNVNEPILEFKPEKCECSVFGKVADLGHTSH